MSDVAIRVENLCKEYQIGQLHKRNDTLREALAAGLGRLGGRSNGASGQPSDDRFWALKDVSFEVKRGEVVGIIGRNGAGKSTLLKILSRITEPTSGRAILNGRVGSLLEVGTGFHPELTGRENIYLSGAMLGMRRREIDNRFDEIAAFAEIDKFLDTPVKRYSSGMYVRLAFSVAAHLEPEILLVDEVLAVGDAAFRKKCLGKMGDVAVGGKTILFVSHNMGAIQSLCKTSILLQDGKISAEGLTKDVVNEYLDSGLSTGKVNFDEKTPRQGDGNAVYTQARLVNSSGNTVSSVAMGTDLVLELSFTSAQPIRFPSFSVRLHTPLGQDIAAWRTQNKQGQMPPVRTGGVVCLRIRDLKLLPGIYHFAIGMTDGYQTLDYIEDALLVEIAPRETESENFSSFRRNETIYSPCEWLPNYE